MSVGLARPGIRMLPSPSVALASVLLFVVLALVVAVPFLPIYHPYAQDLAASLAPPGDESSGTMHWLGTDILGRDLLSRLALAGRVSIGIAASAMAISLVLGVALGLLAGFFGGAIESVIMGLADLQLAIPRMLLLIAVISLAGPSIPVLIAILGLTSWVSYGRVVRAMALSLRQREFVLAATTLGASAAWNIRRHLLPHVMPQMIILASFELGQLISLEAALSYLGLGIQPPLPSWGLMISEGQAYLALDPWLTVLPGLAIFLVIAGVQFLTRAITGEDRDDIGTRDAG